eukprot:25146-Pelagococcus_subviridis.AAC.2
MPTSRITTSNPLSVANALSSSDNSDHRCDPYASCCRANSRAAAASYSGSLFTTSSSLRERDPAAISRSRLSISRGLNPSVLGSFHTSERRGGVER